MELDGLGKWEWARRAGERVSFHIEAYDLAIRKRMVEKGAESIRARNQALLPGLMFVLTVFLYTGLTFHGKEKVRAANPAPTADGLRRR